MPPRTKSQTDKTDEAVPLSQSENLGTPGTTTVGDKEFDLPLDTSVALKSLASQATSVDSQGVERVINRYVDGWEPAPLEPDPAEVARLEQAREAFDAHREARQNLLGLGGQSADEVQDEQLATAEVNREDRPGAEQRPVEAASA